MGRHKQTYTLVFLSHGAQDYETFDSFDALQAAARKLEDATAPLLFGMPPIPFKLDREPRLVLRPSEAPKPPRKRLPRVKKEGAPKNGNGHSTRVDADLFDDLGATNPLDVDTQTPSEA